MSVDSPTPQRSGRSSRTTRTRHGKPSPDALTRSRALDNLKSCAKLHCSWHLSNEAMTFRLRLITIAALIAASIWALFPRTTIEQVALGNGAVRYDTARRFPI